MSYPICLYIYIYTYIYSPICPLYIYIYIYIYSPLYEQPPIYRLPRWPVLGSGTNNAGQLIAIHTTCRGGARLVLLHHATGRAIRSIAQPCSAPNPRPISPQTIADLARQLTTRLRQDATTSVAARLLHMINND